MVTGKVLNEALAGPFSTFPCLLNSLPWAGHCSLSPNTCNSVPWCVHFMSRASYLPSSFRYTHMGYCNRSFCTTRYLLNPFFGSFFISKAVSGTTISVSIIDAVSIFVLPQPSSRDNIKPPLKQLTQPVAIKSLLFIYYKLFRNVMIFCRSVSVRALKAFFALAASPPCSWMASSMLWALPSCNKK